MTTGNGYFEHDPAVIDLAYSLVKEYDRHDREQDKRHPYVSPQPKNRSKQGGMIEAGTRKAKRKRGKNNDASR
jgi:hypothetical protein